MEADGESSPQLWSAPTTLLIPVHRRHGRTSPILNPEVLILAIPILVLLIIFLILPPFFSYTNHQILKPSLVQKGWDSINIFLVLIAVLCGVFAKRNDDNSSSLDADGEKNLYSVTDVSDDNIRKSIASSKWLDFPDKSEYDKMTSSRSYPDLRQESLWGCESNGFKCFDDLEVNFHRQPEKLYHRERRSQKLETEAVAEPAPPVRRRRSVHSCRNDDEKNKNKSPPPPPAAPSLQRPPPEPEFIRPVAEMTERTQREKGSATKEIATAIAALQYGTQTQRKKKVKTRDIYESATEDLLPPSALAPPSTPPPPPPPPPSQGPQSMLKKSSKSKLVHSVPTTAQPPPPPNSIFANIFKTGSKSNRSQLSSASSQPPPPPPPPPYSIFNNIFSSGSKSKRCQISSASSHLIPPPTSSILIPSFENLTKSRRFKNSSTPTPPLPPPGIRLVHTGKPPKPPKPNTSSHNETAIIVPPPPPPPFRTPEINFVSKGDLARKRSTNSSPELENHVQVMSIEFNSGHSIRPSVSCPSPDVNTKADTFISRLRDGWKLEKLNSINERQNSVSSTSNRL